MNFPKTELISFRDEIKTISNTGYFTHSIYFHPAKFIPQIVKFCLNNYCSENDNILDPFAGSGTVGLEAALNGFNSYLLDINPIINYIYPIKIPKISQKIFISQYDELLKVIDHIFKKSKHSKIYFHNEGLKYWYPPEIYNVLSQIWGQYHSNKDKFTKLQEGLFLLALFKTSKYYSYAEHTMPKLFTSKRKKHFIHELMCTREFTNNINDSLKTHVMTELKKLYCPVKDLNGFKSLKNKVVYYAADSYSFPYGKLPVIDCIITSPPYLQAQEYIRTFKLELMWLGYIKSDIRSLTKLEIPYREPKDALHNTYIDELRKNITDKYLLKLFDSYFWFTLKTLERASERLKKTGKLCVLIGNPKISNIKVEIWKVIYDYFVNTLKFKYINVYQDKIKVRKLFMGRKNANPDGMKSEYLITLEKR